MSKKLSHSGNPILNCVKQHPTLKSDHLNAFGARFSKS